jgi:hypothetical protein
MIIVGLLAKGKFTQAAASLCLRKNERSAAECANDWLRRKAWISDPKTT